MFLHYNLRFWTWRWDISFRYINIILHHFVILLITFINYSDTSLSIVSLFILTQWNKNKITIRTMVYFINCNRKIEVYWKHVNTMLVHLIALVIMIVNKSCRFLISIFLRIIILMICKITCFKMYFILYITYEWSVWLSRDQTIRYINNNIGWSI